MAWASHPGGSMRVAPIGLIWLAVVAGACSLSLDGDHFRDQTPDPGDRDASPGSSDARDPEGSRPPRADAAPEPDFECASASDTCKPRCEEDDCVIDCRQADTCEAHCKEATCNIDCTGAERCDRVKCEDDSECLLDCTGADVCGFERCDGELSTCAGGVLACNRDCP